MVFQHPDKDFIFEAYFWLEHFNMPPDVYLRQDRAVLNDLKLLFAADQQTRREYYKWKHANR